MGLKSSIGGRDSRRAIRGRIFKAQWSGFLCPLPSGFQRSEFNCSTFQVQVSARLCTGLALLRRKPSTIDTQPSTWFSCRARLVQQAGMAKAWQMVSAGL